MNAALTADLPSFEVRFIWLNRPGSGHAFPCDGQGHVDLDALSERARNNYLYARAMVGREIALPRVSPVASAEAIQHH
jgi:hypothetical protein